MKFSGKLVIALFSATIAFFALIGWMINLGHFNSSAQQPINDSGAQIRIFESVLQHIQNDYVDEPNLEKVRAGALKGLADGLDPYSAYLTAEQVKEMNLENDAKTKVGIGAEFSQVTSYLYIISVIKDSPADKAGLMAGDIIEYIGSRASRDVSLYDAKQLIQGKAGTTVKLRVVRTGEKPQTIEVTRGSYQIPKVSAEMKDGKIGIVKVFSLEKGEADDIKNKIAELQAKGAKKIVLDLRNVSKGGLDEAVEVANLFIKEGEIAKVIGRDEKVIKTYTADKNKQVFDGELVALIDLGTAGAGEVVASAILENKRGEVVGEQSFGAGAEQEFFPLRGGDGLLLTTKKWASINGKTFLSEKRSTSGVIPSIKVEKPETPEPIELEELVEQKKEEDENNPQVAPTDEPKKEAKKPKKSRIDIQLNKAIEVLQGKHKASTTEE